MVVDTTRLAGLLKRQCSNGAFPAYVINGPQRAEDHNCFITNLVVLDLIRIIRKHGADSVINAAIEKAIDFIESCELPGVPGRFGFYPAAGDSPRLPIKLGADLDDTALSWLSLLLHGRRTVAQAQAAFELHFMTNRQLYNSGIQPPWFRPGAFKTWIDTPMSQNTMDGCVNMHVLALMAHLGLQSTDTYTSTLMMVQKGVESTRMRPTYLRGFAPFYAHPREVLHVVERAHYWGVGPLATTLQKCETYVGFSAHSFSENPLDQPICCNAWGKPLWIAPVVQQLREYI